MSTKRLIIGLIIVFIGLNILLDLSLFKFLFAIIIILIGIRVLSGRHTDFDMKNVVTTQADLINEVFVFTPINKLYKSNSLKGGKIVTVFSGGQVDLRHTKAAQKNIEIELVAVFAGIKLIVPKTWRVNSEGVGILGGYDNKTTPGSGTVLKIKGSSVFGGVEIIN